MVSRYPTAGSAIDLDDEIRTQGGIGQHRASDVVAALRVGRDQQALRRDQPYSGDPLLAGIIDAVGIRVVEYFAHQVGTVESRVSHDPHCRGGRV